MARNLANARRDLDEALFRAYRHVYLLGKDNKLRHIDLGQITSSSAGSIVELILRELERNDEITDGRQPGKLVKYWPPALVEWSTKAGARRLLLVAAIAAAAESRHHQADDLRRRDPGHARLRQQGLQPAA